MTQAPVHPKKSPAQVKAYKAFAAGGRAAQARTRSAAMSTTGKPPPRSKARQAATRKWAAAGRAAQATRRSGKKVPVAKKKAALPLAHHLDIPVIWLPGCNNELPTCISVAVANHLLAMTGTAATDAQILKLHDHAGGDNGATFETVLDAASYHGLTGIRLKDYRLTDEILPGMVCGVQTSRGYHAVLSHPFGVVSWGLVMASFGEPEEAWVLEWETL